MATTTGFQQKPQEGNKGQEAMHKGQDAMHKAGDAAASAADKAKDVASSTMDKAREFAGTAADKAKDAASTVGRRAEDATHAVGSGMQSLAGTLRENLPREGMLGSAASTVAGSLESTGRYLEREGLQGIGEDVTTLIRRNPIPAMLVGIGLGFLLARVTMPSRS